MINKALLKIYRAEKKYRSSILLCSNVDKGVVNSSIEHSLGEMWEPSDLGTKPKNSSLHEFLKVHHK